MKGLILFCAAFVLSTNLSSCSKVASNSGACASAGYYGDQNECQNSVSLGTCSSTTVQTGSNNLVCWKSSTTSNQTGNPTNTNTNTSCAGQNPPWTLGAWAPAACTAGVAQRTRTVSCNQICPCTGAQPSSTESCSPNMYNSVHYDSECTSKGGTLANVDGNRVCSFSGGSCPGGWVSLTSNNLSYTTTSPTSGQDNTTCTGGRNTVYTGSHSTFTPIRGVESTSFCSWRNCFGCKSTTTIYATVTSIACY